MFKNIFTATSWARIELKILTFDIRNTEFDPHILLLAEIVLQSGAWIWYYVLLYSTGG